MSDPFARDPHPTPWTYALGMLGLIGFVFAVAVVTGVVALAAHALR